MNPDKALRVDRRKRLGTGTMRALATIIAVFSAVTTAGPLRCPCHLVAQFGGPAHLPPTIPATPVAADCHGCVCQSHANSDESRPTEKTPERPEPCKHGQAVDLVAPIAGADRQLGDGGADESPLAAPGDPLATSPTGRRVTVLSAPPDPHPSSSTRLRYCHSFRC